MVVTCEHFHSRVTSHAALERLRDLVETEFDEVEILCYFRDQASLLASAYSAAVQMGETRDAIAFSEFCEPGNPYFDYHLMLTRWTEVFRRDQIRPRVFFNRTL